MLCGEIERFMYDFHYLVLPFTWHSEKVVNNQFSSLKILKSLNMFNFVKLKSSPVIPVHLVSLTTAFSRKTFAKLPALKLEQTFLQISQEKSFQKAHKKLFFSLGYKGVTSSHFFLARLPFPEFFLITTVTKFQLKQFPLIHL